MLLSKKYTQVYKSVEITVDIDASRYTNVSSSPDETFVILCFRDSPKFACIPILVSLEENGTETLNGSDSRY